MLCRIIFWPISNAFLPNVKLALTRITHSCPSQTKRVVLDAVLLEVLVLLASETASDTTDSTSKLLANSTNRLSEALRSLPNGAAKALCGCVQTVAESLCYIADSTSDAPKETPLTFCLLASSEDIVDATQETAKNAVVVRHCLRE